MSHCTCEEQCQTKKQHLHDCTRTSINLQQEGQVYLALKIYYFKTYVIVHLSIQ